LVADITVGVIDQRELVSDTLVFQFDARPAVLIAASIIELEPNKPDPPVSKLASTSATTV